MGEAQYIEQLQIRCAIERLVASSPKLQRVEELFQRTTQFNTTGRKFSCTELAALAANPDAHLFAIEVSDRLGDYGLVGAAVIVEGEIAGLAVSCRALGMGIEHRFLRHILDEMKDAVRCRFAGESSRHRVISRCATSTATTASPKPSPGFGDSQGLLARR